MDARIRKLNSAATRPAGEYVLYWCRANRRAASNHALVFAAEMANSLELPLLVFEDLPCSVPYASDRFHTFALEGVAHTAAALRKLGIGYAFHCPRHRQETSPLASLLRDAAAFVTDDYPSTLAARQQRALPERLDQASYAVESSCIVPPACIGARSYAAYSLRPKIHKLLPQFLKPAPELRVRHRFRGAVPEFHTTVASGGIATVVSECDIDHTVPPSTAHRGGRPEAMRRLERFLADRLNRYARDKNEPSKHATSGLSPYLHYGHISPLEIALAVREHAAAHKLVADEFLEELIVRRELAFNFAYYAGALDSLDELPEWARKTIHRHRRDRRDPLYTRDQFESAATDDALWNATQTELLRRGTIHGYYRMYWGKKIVEWSATAQDALATMIHLHDRYALDGHDPNTFTNILWCFGLHDRPWPERPVFGQIRTMTLGGMERKTDVAAYLKEIDYLERTGKELTT